MSAKNRKPKDPRKELEEQLAIFDSFKYEGPKIVINRTSIHKI